MPIMTVLVAGYQLALIKKVGKIGKFADKN
jgi:hypothetical protein